MNDSDEALKTRVLELFVNESGEMFVESALNQDPSADWYEIEPDAGVLTVRLSANATTGYEWTFTSTDESAVELITSEYIADEAAADQVGVGGTYVASFRGLTAGTAHLTLYYGSADDAAPVDTRTLEIAVAEDTALTLNFVEMEEILG